MNRAQRLITSSSLIISPHLTHCVPPSQFIFLCVRAGVCVPKTRAEKSLSCQRVCYFTAILDNDLFHNPQLEGLTLERE